MRHVIPTHHIGKINIELNNFNKETGWTLFDIEFDAFTKTKISLTGETIKQISEIVNKISKKVL